jgi:hypothetical protein
LQPIGRQPVLKRGDPAALLVYQPDGLAAEGLEAYFFLNYAASWLTGVAGLPLLPGLG